MTDTEKNKLGFETVSLDDEASALVIIDQTRLPNEQKILRLTTQKEIWDAIYLLQVRGAPAIGVAAAYGIYLAAKEIDTTDYNAFAKAFDKAREYLNSSRPTAVKVIVGAVDSFNNCLESFFTHFLRNFIDTFSKEFGCVRSFRHLLFTFIDKVLQFSEEE